MTQAAAPHTLLDLIWAGGFAMWPLLLCSLAVWAVIMERAWVFRRLGSQLRVFHHEAVHVLLTGDREAAQRLCARHPHVPTAEVLQAGLERLASKEPRIRARWAETMNRRRQSVCQDLRSRIWILGTIGSAAPFIGLFGTVIGILRSFQDMARSGSGGFTVVAAGISESLVATSAGIVVAVIAVMAFNAFQTRWTAIAFRVQQQSEELAELVAGIADHGHSG